VSGAAQLDWLWMVTVAVVTDLLDRPELQWFLPYRVLWDEVRVVQLVCSLQCTVRQKGPNVVVSKNVTFCCFWIFLSFKKVEGDRWRVT